MELVRSDGVPASKDIISSVEAFMDTVDDMIFSFARVLAVAASEVIDSTSVSISMLGLDFVNFCVLLRDYFLAFNKALPNAKDNISLMS